MGELKDSMKNTTVLKFTYELTKTEKTVFPFVTVTGESGLLTTSVHTNFINTGDPINFSSVAPERYMHDIGVIESFFHRAHLVCSS